MHWLYAIRIHITVASKANLQQLKTLQSNYSILVLYLIDYQLLLWISHRRGKKEIYVYILLFYIAWRTRQGLYQLLMMDDADGTRTCIHPHVSRPLFQSATDTIERNSLHKVNIQAAFTQLQWWSSLLTAIMRNQDEQNVTDLCHVCNSLVLCL